MIFFCHIPKTAGTTFNFILRKNFGNTVLAAKPRISDLYTDNDFRLDRKIFTKINVVSGHGVRPYEQYQAKGIKWVTFLRDPLETLVSLYVHQFTSNNKIHEKFNIPFNEWLEKFGRANRQTKWICGEENLEKAIQILSKFSFVGIVEKFDESMLLMKKELDIKDLEINYEKKMMGRDNSLKKSILKSCEEFKELIEPRIELDLKLYAFAKGMMFDKYVNSYGGEKRLKGDTSSVFNSNYKKRFSPELMKYKIWNNIIHKPYFHLTK